MIPDLVLETLAYNCAHRLKCGCISLGGQFICNGDCTLQRSDQKFSCSAFHCESHMPAATVGCSFKDPRALQVSARLQDVAMPPWPAWRPQSLLAMLLACSARIAGRSYLACAQSPLSSWQPARGEIIGGFGDFVGKQTRRLEAYRRILAVLSSNMPSMDSFSRSRSLAGGWGIKKSQCTPAVTIILFLEPHGLRNGGL